MKIFKQKIGEFPSEQLLEIVHFLKKDIAPGMFIMSGSDLEVRNLINRIDSGKIIDLEKFSNHSLATCLRRYFETIPEPVCMFRNYNMFIAADSVIFEERRKFLLKKLIWKELDVSNRVLLSELCYLLNFLTRKENFHLSRLKIEDVSPMFGPILLKPRDNAAHHVVLEIKFVVRIFDSLIENADYYFLDPEIEKKLEKKKKASNQPVSINLSSKSLVRKNSSDEEEEGEFE